MPRPRMRLHLGCGKRYLPGWIRVDAQAFPHVQHQNTVDDLNEFDAKSVDEIYACHVLEHVSRHDIQKVLVEWHRVLRPGGIVRIAVPDWDAVVSHYTREKDLNLVMGLVVGGQRNAFDYHNCLFSFDTLAERLGACGFDQVQRYDWQSFLPKDFDDYSRSYLPHMDFEHGQLMSLNVQARKK